MRPVRSIAALGLAGALYAPLPAAAAPAPCPAADTYAARSGAVLFRLDRVGPAAGGDVGDAASAFVTPGRVVAAAVSRLPDGSGDPAARTAAQQAPPDHARPAVTRTGAGAAGPLRAGAGSLTAHARWRPGTACGTVDGDVTRADVAVDGVRLPGSAPAQRPVRTPPGGAAAPATGAPAGEGPPAGNATTGDDGTGADGTRSDRAGSDKAGRDKAGRDKAADDGAAGGRPDGAVRDARPARDLLRVSGTAGGRSTTRLAGRTAVATATVGACTLDVAGGAVRVRILRAPTLAAHASRGGVEVRYVPAQVEVSGPGIATRRLAAAGDEVAVTLGRRAESLPLPAPAGRVTPVRPVPLPLPSLPGLLPTAPGGPGSGSATGPESGSATGPESGSATGAGTRVTVRLGEVRQAARGRAVAARATALRITVSGAPAGARGRPGYAGTTALDLGVGVLEAAAVAPGPAGGTGGGVSEVSASAGGLPVTGPDVGLLVTVGLLLLLGGGAGVVVGLRGRGPR